MNIVWSQVEREFIVANAGVLQDREIARKLSETTGRKVTLHAVRKQRQKLGLKKLPGRYVCKLRTWEEKNEGKPSASELANRIADKIFGKAGE